MIPCILPSNHVANKKTSNISNKASISYINTSTSTTATSRFGSRTKINLRYYKTNKYLALVKV